MNNKNNEKINPSTNIYQNISLLEYSRINKWTRSTIKKLRPESEASQLNSLDKVKKKRKKENEESNHENQLRLYNINFLNNQQENFIFNKCINRIQKNFLPTYIKVIDAYVKIIMVENTYLYTVKKNVTKEWIKQCLGGELRRKIPDSSKILGMQEIAFHQITFQQFQTIFYSKIKEFNLLDQKSIFKNYKLPQRNTILWPVMILQPLNFNEISCMNDLIMNQVRDDRAKLPFLPGAKIQQTQIQQQLQNTIISNSSEQELMIWYIGTSVYNLIKITQLTHFNQINKQISERNLIQTPFKAIQQDIKEMIQIYNSKIQKNNEIQFKADDKKLFLRRIIKSKQSNQLFIILRFKQTKQNKLILVRSLKTNQLFWSELEAFKICYNLPQFNQQELLYLYLLDKISQSTRQQVSTNLLLSGFFHKNIDQQQIFKQFYNNKIYEEKRRCVACYYILHTLPCLECFFCKKAYHKQCLQQIDKKIFKFLGSSNEYWCCKKCEPCKICFSFIQSNPITCFQCKKIFHNQCGKTRQSFDLKYKYECQQCLKCDLCNRKAKQCGGDAYVFVQNRIYCNECKIISNGQYCSVCKKSWNNEIKQSKAQWVQCTCNSWVHKSCDQMLKKNYQKFDTQNAEYNCPKCRNVIKRKYLNHIIEILMKFDEFAYFIEPTYQSFADYRQIISHPMCFKKMMEKCNQGCYDSESKQKIVQDFNLIIKNALLYNMPKDHSHYSARILKLMGDLAIEYLDSFFDIQALQLIQNKTITNQIIQKEKELYRYLYQHYLEIVLNKNSTKSKVVIKLKNPPNPLPDLLYFKSRQILNNFKNSQLSIVYVKQIPKLQHLFSLPKILQPIKLPITKPICYYHNDKNIISTCQICWQSFCCVKKCFLHQKCKQCGQKGCRCYNWQQCGCKPGYNVKDLQHPSLKPYNGNILQITQMYRYCLKCCILNIKHFQCKYCNKVCTFDYEACIGCQQRYHRSCLKKSYIPDHCNQCQRKPQNQLKLNEILKQEAKKKVYKLMRVDKYVSIALNIFLEHNINLNPYYVKKMIFENYDKIQEFSEQIENFNNYFEKFSQQKIKQQKYKLIELAIKENTMLLKSKLTQFQEFICNKNFLIKSYMVNDNYQIYPKYEKIIQKYDYLPNSKNIIDKCDEIIQKYETEQLIQKNFQTNKGEMQIQKDQKNYKCFTYSNQIQIIIDMLKYNKPKLQILSQDYIFTNSLIFNISTAYIIQNNYKQLYDLQKIVTNIFLSLYNEYKLYPRVGSTCLIQLKDYDITVYKKWSKQKGVTIRLRKVDKQWKLQIDRIEITIKSFEDLVTVLKRFKNFQTLEEVGYFLGFHIYTKKQVDYSYTKFLQTNLLDNDSFSDRKQKILNVYDRIKNNVVKKKQLFFLKKKTNETQSNYQNINPPYITFQQLKKEIEDQPLAEKVNLKITPPTREIFIAPSTIHKLGLFAKKIQPKNTILIQYIGQILSQPIADVRQSQFHLGCYMFGIPKKQQQYLKPNQDTIDQYTPHIHSKKDIIDATFRGNQARYLNHSCDPNCASKIEERDGKHQILIYSIRDIQAFQELTYDYQFKVSADQKIVCTCGAKNCQGRLN